MRCYLPYSAIGWQVFGFLAGYLSEEGFANGHGVFLLELLGRVVTAATLGVQGLCCAGAGCSRVPGRRFAFAGKLPSAAGPRVLLQARQAVILGAVLLVALSPHYPWYLGWLAPLACLAPLPSVLWMLAAAPLLAHGSFEYLAVPGAVYGPAIILAAIELYRGLTRRLAMPSQAIRSVQ